NDKFMFANDPPQNGLAGGGIPGEGSARRDVAPIGVVNRAMRLLYRQETDRRIVNLSLLSCLTFRSQVGLRRDRLASAGINHDGLAPLLLRRRCLPAIGEAISQSERGRQPPRILSVKIVGALVGDI